jgi:flagellin-like hook-associated protein FlgL
MNNSGKIKFLIDNIDSVIICNKLKSFLAEIKGAPRNSNIIQKINTFFANSDILQSDVLKKPKIIKEINKLETENVNSNQILLNCNQTISFINTGNSSLEEINELLSYAETLCIEAANETKTATDKTQMAEEYLSLIYEMQIIAKNTEYNDVSIFNNTSIRNSNVGEFTFRIRNSTLSNTLTWQVNVAWRLGADADKTNLPYGSTYTVTSGSDMARNNSRYQTLYRYLLRPDYIDDQRYLSTGNRAGYGFPDFDLNSIQEKASTLTAKEFDIEGSNVTKSNWNRGTTIIEDLGSQCLSTVAHSNAELEKVKIVKQAVNQIYTRGITVNKRIESIIDNLMKQINITEISIQDFISNCLNNLSDQLIDAIQYYEIKAKMYNKFIDM